MLLLVFVTSLPTYTAELSDSLNRLFNMGPDVIKFSSSNSSSNIVVVVILVALVVAVYVNR